MTHAGNGTFDVTAIGVTALCLAHCAALPLVAATLPVMASWMKSELVHFLFVALAAPLSILALAGREAKGLLATAIVGLALLLAGAMLHANGVFAVALTAAGGIVLVAAHTLNWRRREFSHRAIRSKARHRF